MPQIDPVILQLKADLRDYQAKTAQAERLADQRLGAIERRGDTMAKRFGGSFSAASKAALAFGTALAGAFSVREIAQLIDSAKKVEAQLRLATRESGNFAQAQDDVRRIAFTTRSELEATAVLYSNLQRNAGELRITQEQAARATETVAKSFKISGATTVEAAQSTRQLVQALQSGVLRGDEFNSVMEGAPRLAKLIADSLGVTTDQLRKMAEEGKLTSAALTKALTDKKFTASIDEEAKALPKTFGEAMTQIENSAMIIFGAFDRGGQFSTAITNFADDGAQDFAKLENAAESFGRTVRSEFAGIVALMNEVIGTIRSIGGLLGGLPSSVLSTVNEAVGYLNPLTLTIRALRENPIAAAAREQSLRDTTPSAANFADFRRRLFQPANPPSHPVIAGAGGSSAKPKATKGRSGPSVAELARRAADDLDRLALEELRAKADLATSAEERADIEKDILAREKANRSSEIKDGDPLAAARREILDALYGQAGVVDKQTGEIITQGKAGLFARKINRDLEERQARLANDMLATQADTYQALAAIEPNARERARLEAEALALNQQIERNLLEQAIATGEVADAAKARAALQTRQSADRRRVELQNLSPGKRYLNDLQTEAENLGDAYEDIAVRGLERMNQQLSQAVKNSLGLHGVLGDIIGDFIELAIRQQILGPLANAIFGGTSLFGGGGGAFASSSGSNSSSLGLSSLAGGRAGGGYVEGGKLYRVNEGAKIEAFRPQGSGEIIPLGEVAAVRGGGSVSQHITIQVNAEGALLTTQVQRMVQAGMEQAAQIGVSGGAAEAERRIMSRSRRTIPR